MNDPKPHGALIRLARWWATTSKAQRLEAVKASIRGDDQAPPLETLHLAIILAETAAARERLGGSETLHGEAAPDA